MELKNKNPFVMSVLDDIRKAVAENAEACGRAKASISGAVCIFESKSNNPKSDFQSVKR